MEPVQLSQLQQILKDSVDQSDDCNSFTNFLNCNYRSIGIVKWYDKKKRYGFIRSMLTGEELFVHHKDIVMNHVNMEGYLVCGEYVEYKKVNMINHTEYNFKAIYIHGVCDGPLMCESSCSSLAHAPSEPRSHFTPMENIGHLPLIDRHVR